MRRFFDSLFWMFLVLVLWLLATHLASAKPVAEAFDGRNRITLHDEAGVCLGAARMAVYTDGVQKIPGCWVARPGFVHIVFLDGDVAQLGIGEFKEPKSL